MRLLRPDALFSSVLDIDAAWLGRAGVDALLLDLDNTVVARGDEAPSEEVAAWASGLLGEGVRLCILSNTSKERLGRTGELLGVPVVGGALKPFGRGYARACELLGVPREAAAMVGDQSYTDILGAHLFGMRAFMVEPLGEEDLPHTRLLRAVDHLATRGMEPLGRKGEGPQGGTRTEGRADEMGAKALPDEEKGCGDAPRR